MSSMTGMRWSELPEAERKKLRHDVKGSLCVFEGFHNELQDALTVLSELVNDDVMDLQTTRLNILFADDVEPCLDFLEKTSLRISSQLETLHALCPECKQ